VHLFHILVRSGFVEQNGVVEIVKAIVAKIIPLVNSW